MRSIAQKRLTAVGRVAAKSAASRSIAGASGSPAAAAWRAPRAIPKAAVTPIAGAPRTAIVRIASATSSGRLSRSSTVSAGNRR